MGKTGETGGVSKGKEMYRMGRKQTLGKAEMEKPQSRTGMSK